MHLICHLLSVNFDLLKMSRNRISSLFLIRDCGGSCSLPRGPVICPT